MTGLMILGYAKVSDEYLLSWSGNIHISGSASEKELQSILSALCYTQYREAHLEHPCFTM